MKYIKDRLFITLLILGFASVIAGAKDAGNSPEDVSGDDARTELLAVEVDDAKITLGDFEAVAKTQSPVFQQDLMKKEKRTEFLEKIINIELLAAEARRRGYDKDPEVLTVKKNQLSTLMNRTIAEGFDETDPTEAEMKKYYQDHIENYDKPEKMRARQILIKDKAEATKLLAELLKKKISQYEFRRIAQEKSIDEHTKNRGGDLTFFTRVADRRDGDVELHPLVVQAVFAIKENGAIYPKLIETDKGFHILMRTGYRKKMNLSFEDAKDRLVQLVKRELHKEKTEKSIDVLMKKFKVTLYEENLKDVVIDLSGGPNASSKNMVPGAVSGKPASH